MGKLYSLVTVLLVTVGGAYATPPTCYEWWFDDDVSSAKTEELSDEFLDFQVDTSELSCGIHSFNCRLLTSEGDVGSIFRKVFVVTDENLGVDSCEWWLDDNYPARKIGQFEAGSSSFMVNLSNLHEGLHSFCYRLIGYDRQPGPVYITYFYVVPEPQHTYAYEYWFDNDYEGSVTNNMEAYSESFEIDIPDLSPGLHYFNCRLHRDGTDTGSIYRKAILVSGNTDSGIEYECWIDDNYSQIRTGDIIQRNVMLIMDLDGVSEGLHTFHYRIKSAENVYGPVYTNYFYYYHPTDKTISSSIIGYKHSVNDIDLGYAKLEEPETDSFTFETSLPDKDQLFNSTPPISEQGNPQTFTVRYTVQFLSDKGWMEPVYWDFELDSDHDMPICKQVRVSYDGRYLRLITDEEEAEILFTFDGAAAVEDAVYDQPVDVLGLGSLSARAQKQGYKDSETVEYDVRYYADEEHAVTAEGGLLEAAFEWDEEAVKDMVESYRLEGILNDEDYRFVANMGSLQHLDIKDVAEARIPDRAFADSKLVSISMPEDIAEYGENLFSGSSILSSIVWNSTGRSLNTSLTGGLLNPNVLIYVPAENLIDDPTGLNIVTDGKASSINLLYGYPYYAERDFHADKIQLIQEFTQETTIDQCGGWETLVLPFTPDRIIHERYGETVPFAAWDGDVKGDYKPFWLYSSTTDGWEMASTIEQDVPYIISMPNNPEYVYFYNLAGKVKFAATDVEIVTESNVPYATNWIEDTQFVGTYMPIKDEGILSLNVADTGGELTPGSVFVRNAETPAFGAYMRDAASRKQMPVFGKSTGILLPAVADGNIVVTSPAPGTISISSTRECKVQIITSTGIIMHTLDLNPGETRSVEGLPKDLYIVAGAKVLVR